MDIKTIARENFVRILALISLVIGLGDAARLLGVSGGQQDPMQALGVTGFVLLAILALTRLFAAVGLWISSSWGGVLVIGATLLEYILLLVHSPHIHISTLGLLVRTVVFVGILGLLILRYRHNRAHVHD
ncbi:hypothetical protein [Mariluticola halotolerans]|uniref:hypothetical protein n=1 Tax=Mariluticola halotolerans TaxID=2909283 RepID=UPI0026E2007C|nr:hypothetical protein [Mariluticola halotolerans]UJQ95656.1 hypothetical protein L1P08_06630 [Mariluticola halotolerans]